MKLTIKYNGMKTNKLMDEIRQMYLNAYYGGRHFAETPKPTEYDIATYEDDAAKKAYRPGRKL